MYTVLSIAAVLIVLSLLAYNAYIVWYARSGRYDINRRIDSVTKS